MQNLLIAIAITLCMCFGLRLRYAPFGGVVTPRQKRRLYIWYAALTTANVIILTAALYIWGIMAAFTYLRFGVILYSTVLMIVNVLVIRGRLREHLFVYGVVITCSYLLMSVPNYIITFFPAFGPTEYLYMVVGIYGGILLLSFWPMRWLLRETVTPFLQLDSSEYWNTIWFIPIAFFGTKIFSLGGEHDSGGISQLFSSMLYIAVIILMCMSITAAHKRMQERQLMEEQLADQKLHYAELKARVEEARRTKHDFKHHVAAIRHYMDIDDKEGLRHFCDALVGRSGKEGRLPYTGNVAADGVLYHYMQRAEQEQIDFRYSGTIHSHGIADTDLCALLGNALDNALTACLTIPQGRSITVICQSEKQLLSLVVRNTFDGKIEQSGQELLSRKRGNSNGIGISSMRSICQRYGGSMDLRWDDHDFTVMFILPLQMEES